MFSSESSSTGWRTLLDEARERGAVGLRGAEAISGVRSERIRASRG